MLKRHVVASAFAGIVVVAIATVAVVLAAGQAHQSSQATAAGATTKNASLLQRITSVDRNLLAQVGTADLPDRFTKLSGAPPYATAKGKPKVLYVGAEYCPYCAAQRWSLVVALSRFGSFNDLGLTVSSANEVYPNTASVSFHGTTYTSDYLDFSGVETADRAGKPLDTLSAEQQRLLTAYDAPPYVAAQNAGGIPWLDVANAYAMLSSGYTPQVLSGLTWTQIADHVNSGAGDLVAQGVLGNANRITAAICKVTGMHPASVCQTAPVSGIASQMP